MMTLGIMQDSIYSAPPKGRSLVQPIAAKDATATVLFHFLVRLWTALAVHENKYNADVTDRAVKIVAWLRDGISWPHLRAKRYVLEMIPL